MYQGGTLARSKLCHEKNRIHQVSRSGARARKIAIWDDFRANIIEGVEIRPFFIASQKNYLDYLDKNNYYKLNLTNGRML